MSSVHALCAVAQREETCSVCHAPPGTRCTPGPHLCRVLLLADHGSATMADRVMVLRNAGLCSGDSIVTGPGGAL